MGLNRREFLELTGAAALSAGLPFELPLVHPGGGPRGRMPLLVVIYLRGGQDALNTIVPFADARYREIRPTIAIPAASDEAGGAVLKLDADFGLHPALRPLLPLWERRALAPIVCTGSPHATRSHFDAQDFMEYAAPGSRTVRDGWLNRYLALTASEQGDHELRALATQGLLPRSLRGAYPVLALPSDSLGKEGAMLDEFEALYGKAEDEAEPAEQMDRRRRRDPPPPRDEVKAAGRATVEALRRYQEIAAADTGSKVRYPRGRLGPKLRRIAHVVRAGGPLEVAGADYGGWDHHTGEGGLDGTIAAMLRHLAESLAVFAEDLGEHFERTLVLTMTEFGRTVAENGNAGTDHGHGGAMLVLGGGIAGGRVLGEWPGLEEEELYQGRDLQVTTDFREVMGDVLRGHMGAELPKGFFPDYELGKRGIELFAKRR